MTADLMHDPGVVALLMSLLGALRSAFRPRAELALENLALRQQLANLRRTSGRPRIHVADRAFWFVLSRLWSRWADVLVIVKPDTVVRWHRAGFRLCWRWKSRSRSPAESDITAEVKVLIRQMAEANVGWGAPRLRPTSRSTGCTSSSAGSLSHRGYKAV
jgi:putative transposase